GNSFRKISVNYPQHSFTFTDVPEVDITDLESLRTILKNAKADIIINCAAYTDVNKAESNEDIAHKINAVGPGNLAVVAKEMGAKLVHVSTDYVFNGKGNTPLKESDPTSPLGAYGRTKLSGETLVREVGGDAAIVRTAWLYSEFGNNFVKTMIRLGSEREDVSVVYDQVGTPTYATDLAEAIMHLVNKGIKGCEVYHYTNDGVASWFDFTKYIFKLAGCKANLHAIESYEYPTPAERPAYSVLSKRKIAEAGASVPYWTDSLEKCMKLLLAK
ncbi:MAG: dTDP-4-dehydrorhamnose reductase, partial [Paludibacteraceae bacterium]|nr:dTDP-4-dehydrorhamnose reductase [Paludibacteraceae bacterium]